MAAPTFLTERHFGISFADQQHQHHQLTAHHPFHHPISNSSSASSLQQQQVPTTTAANQAPDFVPPVYHNSNKTNRSFSYHNNNPRKMSHGSERSTSPNSHGSSSHHQTKTGRKGDPRMHRAVAARLNDPNMTLFEALKAGGFDYPDDNNPSYVDSEKITLAQRKNQLSRRLRIARRSDNVSKYPVPSPTDNKNKLESLMEKQKESFQMMQQTMELERRTSSGNPTGLKRACSASHNNDGAAASKSLGKGCKSLLDDDDEVEVEEEQDKKQPSQMMAKFHPQFQQLLVPPQMQFGGQPGPFPAAVAAPNQPPFGMNHQGMGMFYPNAAAGFQIPDITQFAAGTAPNAVAAPSAGTGNPSNISGVALRSLTNTAQSVGLSLEQLALALSSTRNLAHIVLGDDDDKNPASAAEQKKKKQVLALQMYHHEVRPVYSRCMLMAGYKPDTTTESSKEFLKFAWKAWQKEGRYLRDLLEENDMLVADAPDFHIDDSERPAKKRKTTAETEEESESSKDDDKAEEDHGHSHSHSHSNNRGCHTADGRHIHRLEKCGHKAILHQPKDGEAHIDFVVGDKVECYAGVTGQESSTWPSQVRHFFVAF